MKKKIQVDGAIISITRGLYNVLKNVDPNDSDQIEAVARKTKYTPLTIRGKLNKIIKKRVRITNSDRVENPYTHQNQISEEMRKEREGERERVVELLRLAFPSESQRLEFCMKYGYRPVQDKQNGDRT